MFVGVHEWEKIKNIVKNNLVLWCILVRTVLNFKKSKLERPKN